MQITITGPRGSGKTTVALEITKFLRERGCDVKIIGYSPAETAVLESESLLPAQPDAMKFPLPVVVLDSFDLYDEKDIRGIVKGSS
jgi:uridine kinase